MSSPRHSELSLISDSTMGRRESQLGASSSHVSKEVRDPNFIQVRDHFAVVQSRASKLERESTEPADANWKNEISAIFPPTMNSD